MGGASLDDQRVTELLATLRQRTHTLRSNAPGASGCAGHALLACARRVPGVSALRVTILHARHKERLAGGALGRVPCHSPECEEPRVANGGG
jgi:hypothetical protein